MVSWVRCRLPRTGKEEAEKDGDTWVKTQAKHAHNTRPVTHNNINILLSFDRLLHYI